MGLSKPLGSVTGRRVSLLGCPALFRPQCSAEKPINKSAEWSVWGPGRLLSLGIQKLRQEDDREGNSSAVTMHWKVTLVLGIQGSLVPSRWL